MASRRRPLIARTGLNAVPAILVAMGLLVVAAAVPQVVRAAKELTAKGTGSEPASGGEEKKLQQRADDLGRQIDDLARKRDALKDKLDAISQQANQNQWLLSIVLAVAGLLTLAQGAFAFFSAQNYAKQADDAVRKIKELGAAASTDFGKQAGAAVKKIEVLGADASARFPLLAGTERANARAFQRLTEIKEQLDFFQNLYEKSDTIAQQEILSLESFAVTRFLGSDGRAHGVIGHLQLLGRFYADKYVSGGQMIEADFDRALYYYTLVHKTSDRDISALNDLGWLHMVVAKSPELGTARKLFTESLAVNAKQQRALYNLGTMKFDAKDLIGARGDLERAAGIENWETAPNEENRSHVYYNLACTYSRLAENEQNSEEKVKLLDLAAGALGNAAKRGGTSEKTLTGDLNPGGDLAALAANRDPEPTKAIFREAWAARPKD